MIELETPSVSRSPDGMVCIGAGCFKLTIDESKPTAPVKVDASDCPPEVARLLTKQLEAGASTLWRMPASSAQPATAEPTREVTESPTRERVQTESQTRERIETRARIRETTDTEAAGNDPEPHAKPKKKRA